MFLYETGLDEILWVRVTQESGQRIIGSGSLRDADFHLFGAVGAVGE
jgi:hypothetical protein